ncbi:MAG TPA: hypothetical protein VEW48_09690 [Thermoanaerobaculia bacterium]|nr:hypothetical protein [Thermoanaerobaculia bacterium]
MQPLSEDAPYTQEGIMAQIWVAFGQGTGLTRTSQKAVLALQARYYEEIPKYVSEWGEQAVQVLERIRAIGKVAAFKATERGSTVISEDDVNAAMPTVERESLTSWCPPDGY